MLRNQTKASLFVISLLFSFLCIPCQTFGRSRIHHRITVEYQPSWQEGLAFIAGTALTAIGCGLIAQGLHSLFCPSCQEDMSKAQGILVRLQACYAPTYHYSRTNLEQYILSTYGDALYPFITGKEAVENDIKTVSATIDTILSWIRHFEKKSTKGLTLEEKYLFQEVQQLRTQQLLLLKHLQNVLHTITALDRYMHEEEYRQKQEHMARMQQMHVEQERLQQALMRSERQLARAAKKLKKAYKRTYSY